MSKKGKGVVLDSRLPSGVGVFEHSKLQLKHQSLMQDYEELQKEADVMRSKFEAAKQRKLILAAEVRFLRKRYKYFMETNAMNFSSEEQMHLQPLKSGKQVKIMKEQLISRKEASRHRLPPVPEPKKSMKKRYTAKNVTPPITSPVTTDQHLKKLFHGKESTSKSLTRGSVLDHKGRIHAVNDTTSRKAIVGFDLNQDSGASLPTRAPTFDLNEISTGDDDFQSSIGAMKVEEAKKSLIKGLNDEQQNDLKLSVCRNSGEGSSRAGKRKISWQDPVALRV